MDHAQIARWNGTSMAQRTEKREFFWPFWPALVGFAWWSIACFGRLDLYFYALSDAVELKLLSYLIFCASPAAIIAVVYAIVVTGWERAVAYFLTAWLLCCVGGLLSPLAVLIAPVAAYFFTRMIPADSTFSFGGGYDYGDQMTGVESFDHGISNHFGGAYYEPYEQHFPMPRERLYFKAQRARALATLLLCTTLVATSHAVAVYTGRFSVDDFTIWLIIYGYLPMVVGLALFVRTMNLTVDSERKRLRRVHRG